MTGVPPSAGLGVRGVVDGTALLVGRAGLLSREGVAVPAELERAQAAADAGGCTWCC